MAYLNMNSNTPHLSLTRSSHNLSNQTYFDVEQGLLVPTAVYDCVPGDRFNLGNSLLIRTTPLIKPAFTNNLMAKTASFFVPYRIIWKDFEDFFSGGRSGDKNVPMLAFEFYSSNALPYSLLDYFNLPCTSSNPTGNGFDYINALYILSYIKIWNDYFRNPSIDIEIDVSEFKIYSFTHPDGIVIPPVSKTIKVNGIDYTISDCSIFIYWCLVFMSNRINPNITITPTKAPFDGSSVNIIDCISPALVNLPRDLFTSALTSYTSGTPISLPFQSNVSGDIFTNTSPIALKVMTGNINSSGTGYAINFSSGTPGGYITFNQSTKGTLTGSTNTSIGVNPYTTTITGTIGTDGTKGVVPGIYASEFNKFVNPAFSISGGIYPRELRLIFGIDIRQQLRNITGNRYQDLLYAFYGVTTKDYRLNMSEYICGFRYPIYTSEVLQTSESNETPQGNQSGHSIASGVSDTGSKFIDEFGCIINLFWINSNNIYCQGLRRDWRKFSKDDLFFSSFENLGDQEIYREELVYSFNSDALPSYNSGIFGFTPRYSEYKFYNDTVCGGFRGNYRYWTQARIFDISEPGITTSYPSLNTSFIKPNILSNNRIFQTINADYTLKPYMVKFSNRTIAYRPMVNNSLGYLIDHF